MGNIMPDIKLTIHHEAGLHARPLAQFVKVAKQFPCDVRVSNLTSGGSPSSGKSPLDLLVLGVQKGHEISIQADRDQADEALGALQQLVESHFSHDGS